MGAGHADHESGVEENAWTAVDLYACGLPSRQFRQHMTEIFGLFLPTLPQNETLQLILTCVK